MLDRRNFLSLLAAGGLSGSACNRGSTKKLVGVVPKGTNHIFWLTVKAGSLAAGQEYDLDIAWNAPQLEIDSSRQIAIVENLITSNADGIVLAPVDADALVAVVERAAGRGIPVSIFDSGINTDKIVSFVATDNYGAGAMGARRMGEILDGKGQVGVIGFMPGSASTMEREAGFVDTIGKEFPGIEIVGVQFAMADRAKALAESENLMTAYPNLRGLFADNESSTDGTVRAVAQRGASGKIKVVGFDASQELVDQLEAGLLDSLIVQDPFKMGYESTKAIGQHLRGEEPVRKIDSGAHLILKEDLEKPEVHELLFPDITRWLDQG
jgi:ribose transport system substrate-binding protein